MFRRTILARIDEELRSAPARARLIELGDPLARGIQIVRTWRDHQQRVEPFERDDAQHAFEVQEFRRPEFEVTAKSSEGPHLVGEHAIATVSATYYSGGGLPNARA